MTDLHLRRDVTAAATAGSAPSGAGPAGPAEPREAAPLGRTGSAAATTRTPRLGGRRVSGSTLALLPFLAFVALFLVWPMLVVAGHALTPGGQPGLSTMARAVSGPYRSAFRNSLTLAATTAVLGGALGLLLALAVRDLRRPAWFRTALDAWCSVAAQLGGVPLAFAFVAALGTQGVVTKVLAAVGIHLVDSGFSLSSLAGMTVVYLYFQIPLMFLVVMPAVSGLRDSWREAATLMGCGPWRYWRTVALPILTPSMLGGMFLLFINAFSAYATAYVLSSSGQLVPLQIRFVLQGNVITGEQDLGYALVTWTVLLMLAGVGLMTLAQRRAARWSRG